MTMKFDYTVRMLKKCVKTFIYFNAYSKFLVLAIFFPIKIPMLVGILMISYKNLFEQISVLCMLCIENFDKRDCRWSRVNSNITDKIRLLYV